MNIFKNILSEIKRQEERLDNMYLALCLGSYHQEFNGVEIINPSARPEYFAKRITLNYSRNIVIQTIKYSRYPLNDFTLAEKAELIEYIVYQSPYNQIVPIFLRGYNLIFKGYEILDYQMEPEDAKYHASYTVKSLYEGQAVHSGVVKLVDRLISSDFDWTPQKI